MAQVKSTGIVGLGLMSGGLDSILAAKLLMNQGITVIGIVFETPFFSAQHAVKAAQESSPTILTCMGVAGVVGTAVLAVKATPKALALMDAADDEKNGVHIENYTPPYVPLTKWEVVKVTWKEYIPAVTVGALSIACIVGANSINLKRRSMYITLKMGMRRNWQAHWVLYTRTRTSQRASSPIPP